LWNELKWYLLYTALPPTQLEFELILRNAFKSLTGESISTKEPIFVERFAHGGMSSGGISTRFWRDYAIPFLVNNACRIGIKWGVVSDDFRTYGDGVLIEQGCATSPLTNSYQDVETLRWYAGEQGEPINHLSDEQCKDLLFEAVDYLDRKVNSYKGKKVSSSQSLAWPREDVWDVEHQNSLLTSKEIPRLIEYAQLALAFESIFPASTNKKNPVIRAVKKTEPPKFDFIPAFAPSHVLLAPLFERTDLTIV
jgi:hypothetical protein